MKDTKLIATWNFADGWIKSMWEHFIVPAYDALERKDYELARVKIINLVNSTVYYQKKTKSYDAIKKLKQTMNKIVSEEYRKAVADSKNGDVKQIKQDVVQAMYTILETINFMFAGLGCFVNVKNHDPILESMRMT